MLSTIFASRIPIQQQVRILCKSNDDGFVTCLSFSDQELPYRVVIFPSKKFGAATTSANVWVAISGNMGETQQVKTPRGTLEFVFHVS